MASNDENPIITYKGITYRLGLDPKIDIKKLVQSRGDLFRMGVPSRWLAEWELDMRKGLRLPTWIRDAENEADRNKMIDELSADDVFRSQFRAEHDAERSDIEIISWGLNHIERLRKASHESKQKSIQRWQIWLIFAVGVLNIALTVLVQLTKAN
jgi:hypothetical protein